MMSIVLRRSSQKVSSYNLTDFTLDVSKDLSHASRDVRDSGFGNRKVKNECSFFRIYLE